MPYLNSAPFFRGLPLGARFELKTYIPQALGQAAARGEVAAGLLPSVDYVRLQETFERVGPFGIAVRGRAQSVLLFSRKPIRQLDGTVIAVTEESSTSAILLRLLLERRYEIAPAAYARGRHPVAEALVLIGDEALRFQQTNRQYPVEIDLAFEWWLWQHLPFVFAVWAIRKDAAPDEKKQLETALIKSLAMNGRQLASIAQEHAARLGMAPEALQAYLERFIYRLSRPEEDGLKRFQELVTSLDIVFRTC